MGPNLKFRKFLQHSVVSQCSHASFFLDWSNYHFTWKNKTKLLLVEYSTRFHILKITSSATNIDHTACMGAQKSQLICTMSFSCRHCRITFICRIVLNCTSVGRFTTVIFMNSMHFLVNVTIYKISSSDSKQ